MTATLRSLILRTHRPCPSRVSLPHQSRLPSLHTETNPSYRRSHISVAAQQGTNFGAPEEPRHPQAANESLASRLQAAAPSAEAYTQFRAQAAALIRSNEGTAIDLYQTFVSLYGQSDDSLLLFLDLAELAPDQALRSELMSVAGLDAIVADAAQPTTSVADAPMARTRSRTTTVPDASTLQPIAASEDQAEPANMPISPHDSAAVQVDSTESTDAVVQAVPEGQPLHGVPAPVPTQTAEEAVASGAPAEPQTKASPTQDAAASPEEALDSLGFSSELWGVDGDGRENSGGRGAKRKRGRQMGAQGSETPSALSLLDDSSDISGAADPVAERPSVVYWIRQDFRLHDNPALCRAVKIAKAGGGKVLFVYVHSPEEDGDDVWTGNSWRPGEASRLWTHHALQSMSDDLALRYGAAARIVYAHGPAAPALQALCGAVGAAQVVANRRHEPAMVASDKRTEAALAAAGVRVTWSEALLLHTPEAVTVNMASWRGHFGTLMPFYVACEKAGGFVGGTQSTVDTPTALPGAAEEACEDDLAAAGAVSLPDLRLYAPPTRLDGTVVDWGAPIREAWTMTEAAALTLLDDFLNRKLAIYESSRALARGDAVSRLSPYLHFGQISPRTVMARLDAAGAKAVSKTFWRRLVWRDLAYWQLHHWPRMPTRSLRPAYERQEWNDDADVLRRWQAGTTGFPLVDAGMRELWRTGYMHQNVRMVVACFLTEYLGMHWVHGARWFHDTLVDGDLAINSMMWQNAGKSGLDQWNFSVLPTSKATDSKGDYIRRWVPEVKNLPTKHIHAPWDAPAAVLDKAGVRLGGNYPERVTTRDMRDLRHANVCALRAARAAHALENPKDVDDGGYDVIDVPAGAAKGVRGGRVRVFTVPGLRGATAEVGEHSAFRNKTGRGRGRGAGGGRGGGAGRGRGKGRGAAKVAAGQKTLRECVQAK